MRWAAIFLALGLLAGVAAAGEADVVAVKPARESANRWRFDVTVRSNDKGWDYYADAFEVLTPDGRLLGRRILYHPHEAEQPFTRELTGVKIPPEVKSVVVRARHKPRGYDGETMTVRLP
ncbi:MAG: hypothetical protein R3357_05150 [Burkholderiales bacterium]|nr:hypothetical protein [Burkholderiales bacterium]